MTVKRVALGALAAVAVGLLLGRVFGTPEVRVGITMEGSLSGVEVGVDGQRMGQTDDAGILEFNLRRRSGARIALSFSRGGYQSKDTVVSIEQPQTVVSGVFLQAQQATVTLRVQARDESMRPVPGAAVTVNSANVGATDAAGDLRTTVTEAAGLSLTVAVAGSPDPQRTTVIDGTQELLFRVVTGLPLEIRAANRVAGVSIQLGSRLLGRTDSEGRALVSVPLTEGPCTVSFALAGASIADLPISAAEMQTRKAIKRDIQVRPAGPVQLSVHAAIRGTDAPAVGFAVAVDGRKVGETGTEGACEVRLQPLIGDRVGVQVSRGREGVGSVAVAIKPGQLAYTAAVSVSVPSMIRLTAKDRSGTPLAGVQIKRDGAIVGTTDAAGLLESPVADLNVEYRFTFDKPGYQLAAGELVVKPIGPETERVVQLESLYFVATFIDSLNRQAVPGLRVLRQGRVLVTTEGMPVRIDIETLGPVVLELKASDPRYPDSQERQVSVGTNAQEVTVYVHPRPVTLAVRFVWKASGAPVASGYEVEIAGPGYRDQSRTDADGRVFFESHLIERGQQYQVTLLTGAGGIAYPVKIAGYANESVLLVELKSEVRIYTLTGQEQTRLDLYRERKDAVQGRAPLQTAIGELRSTLDFAEYYLRATPLGGAATYFTEVRVVVNRPQLDMPVDMSDPFERAKEQLASGHPDSAMALMRQVVSTHPQYHEAQKSLALHHIQKEEWAKAQEHCSRALDVSGHPDDPYLYLGCGQVSQRLGIHDRCMELCGKAEAKATMAEPARRVALAAHARYLKTLCLHQQYVENDHQRADLSFQDRLERANAVKARWDAFLAECGSHCFDAQTRLGEIIQLIVSSQ